MQWTGQPEYRRPFDNGGTSAFNTMGGVGQNEYTMDGMTVTGTGRRVGFTPPADSITEFKLETSNFDASQGFTSGAAINVVSRSPAPTRLHGSVFNQHWQQRWNATRSSAASSTMRSRSLRHIWIRTPRSRPPAAPITTASRHPARSGFRKYLQREGQTVLDRHLERHPPVQGRDHFLSERDGAVRPRVKQGDFSNLARPQRRPTLHDLRPPQRAPRREQCVPHAVPRQPGIPFSALNPAYTSF
jgi:hypothetical protein